MKNLIIMALILGILIVGINLNRPRTVDMDTPVPVKVTQKEPDTKLADIKEDYTIYLLADNFDEIVMYKNVIR